MQLQKQILPCIIEKVALYLRNQVFTLTTAVITEVIQTRDV